MSSFGAYLRDLRERQGVSLDELSRATRVLHHYLEALEADALTALPAPVFTKGFIRACCQVFGVAPDEALALYDQRIAKDLAGVRITPAPPPPRDDHVAVPGSERKEGRGRGAILVSLVLLVVLGAALFAVTLALQSGRETDSGRHIEVATPQPADPAPAPAPAPPAESVVAQAPVTPPPAQPSPSVQQPAAPPPSATSPGVAASVPAPSPAARAGLVSSYRLVARTTELTWMSVRTEDGRTTEETIPPGQVREWVSNRPFIISVGNAGGVTLELNGRPIPPLGASGVVIRQLVLPAETP